MKVTRVSPITGKASTIEISIPWREYVHRMIEYKRNKKSISELFPELTPNECGFIATGLTFEEQHELAQEDEDAIK